jgi:hypothetical protein
VSKALNTSISDENRFFFQIYLHSASLITIILEDVIVHTFVSSTVVSKQGRSCEYIAGLEAGSSMVICPHIAHLDGGFITNKGSSYLSSSCHDRFWLLNITAGLQLQWPIKEYMSQQLFHIKP